MKAMKRTIAALLALVLVIGMIPGTAIRSLAADLTSSHHHHSAGGTWKELSDAEAAALGLAQNLIGRSRDQEDGVRLEAAPKYDDADPVEIIVVVDDSVAEPASAAQVKKLQKQQDSVAMQISEKVLQGASMKMERRFTTLFNGFSATVSYAQYKQIRDLECVASVFLSPYFKLVPATASSSQMIGGGLFNTTGFNGEGMTIAILDTGVDMNHEMFRQAPTNPALTVADIQTLLDIYDFQAENIVSGVGASTLYHSAKIPFQFDYGGRDTDASPNADHGTHVASTAAGNAGVNEAAVGIAPQAQIINMNVFQPSGGASYSDVLCALEDCILLGVDVVNLSLGADCGYIDYDTEDEWTKNLLAVFDRVGQQGISMAVAAGNAYSAAYGDAFGDRALASNPEYGLVSEPSTYHESLSVAAASNGKTLSPYITVNGRELAYNDGTAYSEGGTALRAMAGRGEIEYVVIPGYGTPEDFAQVDVAGKIALVSRGGGLYYEEKMRNADAAGAIAMIVYNNVPGMLYMSILDWRMPAVFISQNAGEYMKQQENKVLTIAGADKLVESPIAGMSDFSSWGPTGELTLKPEITAPGGSIYSALPGNAYGMMDGTSMAAPHVAGGMAIVQQALEARYPDMSAGELKDLVDTLLMNTAKIVIEGNGSPASPRKQGAGLMSINEAVMTQAYVTVAGMSRPKLELMDDPARTGVYTLSFTVNNMGDEVLYYKASPMVLTDDTTTYTNAAGKSYTVTTETSVALPHTYTTNYANDLVVVPAGATAEVTITVTLTDPETSLAAFENGAYVEGWAVLEQVAADGSALAEPIDLHVPFLAFYGDWTEPPIIDGGFYYETLDGEASDAQAYPNTAFLSSTESTVDTYLGDNNYFAMPYLADRNAISPNSDDFMDSLTGIYTGLLRNTKSLKYTITGMDGTVYYSKEAEYVGKSIYDFNMYFQILPAGIDSSYDGIDPWYGTDQYGSSLPNNTKAMVRIEATLPFEKHESNNKRDYWEFPITIDTEDPQATQISFKESEGRYYLDVAVTDNQYVAAVIFFNLSNTSLLYGGQGFAEMSPGATSQVSGYDVTGFGQRFGMVVHDYAGNSRMYTVSVPGNTDDYAEVVPTNILWEENFNAAWLPENWSMESKADSVNTWYRDVDYAASVDYDETFRQDEWLYTPATDISGIHTDVRMVFDFYTSYWYTTQYQHCNLLVMASEDGQNWEQIWSLWEHGLFTDWTATQAKVTIPEKFQNSTSLRFAFVYQGFGGCNLSIDDVVLFADEAENYITVSATAGEGGSISPAGDTLVRKGTSKTFQVVPDAGFVIADVVIDGQSAGPISSYTFERVGVDHTISATFKAPEADGETVLFENDFESDTFPGNGWSVKTTNTDSKFYTWYHGTLTKLNSTKHARLDLDYYEDPWGGWSTDSSMEPMTNDRLQDEYLISPAVDLTGLEPTLRFDYGFFRYGVTNGYLTLTVDVSTDGGSTWASIWNAKEDVENPGGTYLTGTVELAVPEAYLTENVRFAFHAYKKAYTGYADNDITVAIDNVSLTAPGGAAGQSSYTLTTMASAGGTVSPAGVTSVAAGQSVRVIFTPDEGYRIVSVKVNGRSVEVAESYTIEAMDQSYYIAVEFEQIPETPVVLFDNDFEDPEFPSRGWSVKSKNTNPNYTWKHHKYSRWENNTTKHAYVGDDWETGQAQDEYLLTPVVDLTGSQTRTVSFGYAYGSYGVRYETYEGTFEVSVDGGQTWTVLWNIRDTLPANPDVIVSGQAFVEIPEEYATADVQFAFHYVHPAGGDTGQWAIDDVQLAVTGMDVAVTHVITATAGEGGTITPSGVISVEDGADQSFTITPDEGYVIEDVLVDGRSVGQVSEYTFTEVTDDHSIMVTFKEHVTEGVLFDNDFEDTVFPGRGWQIRASHSNENYTWKRYTYNASYWNGTKHAYITNSYDYQAQDEYLISPMVDLAGTTDRVITFDYAHGTYGVKNRTFSVTLEASVDGGVTWEVIWDVQDDFVDNGNYVIAGSAEVAVPEKFAVDGVQFAFHYVHAADDESGQFALDNVKLTVVGSAPAVSHTITATAGEGGTISPDGQVTVEAGKDQSFTITAHEGFVIADVLVDGQSVGAVDSYTFTAVDADHTISVTFAQESGEKVLFDNDFESDSFPGNGWTVRSSNTCDRFYNWYHGTMSRLNSTKQARIDFDYYEDPWGGWSMDGAVGPMSSDMKQDEFLISPVVDLTGLQPVLTFDYAFFRYGIMNGYMTLTVEISTDGGNTWTSIWNAREDLENPGGSYLMGTVELPIPEAYLTENVQIAFHAYKKAGTGYTDSDITVAIDNVKLAVPSDPCGAGHSLEAVDAKAPTCTEDGVVAHWKCVVCGDLFADAEGKVPMAEEETVDPAKGHNLEAVDAKAPTCTEDGVVAHWKCVLCGDLFADAEGKVPMAEEETVDPAKGHNLEAVDAKAPTCTEDGVVAHWKCVVCGDLFADAEGKVPMAEEETVDPAKGHNLEAVDAKAPTCTEDGVVAHWKCVVCGDLFADAEGKVPMAEEETVDPAKGHSFTEKVVGDHTHRSDATHHEPASYWYSCSCGAVSDSLWFADGQCLPYQVSVDDEWTKGSEDGLSAVTDGEADWFAGVQVDGKELSAEDFSVDWDTGTITLAPAFLEELSIGEHTLTLLFTDGSVSAEFAVNGASGNPPTGASQLMLLSTVMLMATCVIYVLCLAQRKKQR